MEDSSEYLGAESVSKVDLKVDVQKQCVQPSGLHKKNSNGTEKYGVYIADTLGPKVEETFCDNCNESTNPAIALKSVLGVYENRSIILH